MSNTGGDWVNFDVMTAGAGNDVPTLELYPSDMFSRGAWSCTGTGVAATEDASYSVGSANEVTRFHYKGSGSEVCFVGTLPSGDLAGWVLGVQDVHPSSAVTWSLDQATHEVCVDTCDTLSYSSIAADAVQLTEAFWTGNATSGGISGTSWTSSSATSESTGDFDNVDSGYSTADAANSSSDTLSKDANFALMYERISGS